MTPNDSHYAYAVAALDAGLDVIADKPVTRTFAEAADLVTRARAAGRVFAVTHGYSAYPMTRHARGLVRDGAIGAVRFVQVEYIQGGLATRIEDHPQDARQRWVVDSARSGLALVMDAIGCHAQQLACAVTGARITRVVADLTPLMPGRTLVDQASALLEFDDGARGTFTATQAAAGAENEIRLCVFGERGHLAWSHREASYLTLAREGEPAQRIGRGDRHLPPDIVALGRTPRGHPEGPARGVCQHLPRSRRRLHRAQSRRRGAAGAVAAHRGRRAHDGLHRGVHRLASRAALGGRRRVAARRGMSRAAGAA